MTCLCQPAFAQGYGEWKGYRVASEWLRCVKSPAREGFRVKALDR